MFTGFNTSVRLVCVTYYLSNRIRFHCVGSSYICVYCFWILFLLYNDEVFLCIPWRLRGWRCSSTHSLPPHFGIELPYARSGRFRGEISLLRPPRIEPRFVSCRARILVTIPTTLSRLADNYRYVLKPGQRLFLLDVPRTAPVWKGFVPLTATFFKVWSR